MSRSRGPARFSNSPIHSSIAVFPRDPIHYPQTNAPCAALFRAIRAFNILPHNGDPANQDGFGPANLASTMGFAQP
jgi:hypothetical protein